MAKLKSNEEPTAWYRAYDAPTLNRLMCRPAPAVIPAQCDEPFIFISLPCRMLYPKAT